MSSVLTLRRIAERALKLSPDVTHVGLIPAEGCHEVSSVLAGRKVLAYNGDAFCDLPKLRDTDSHVWKPFTVGTAFDRNDLGERFLKVSEVLALDI